LNTLEMIIEPLLEMTRPSTVLLNEKLTQIVQLIDDIGHQFGDVSLCAQWNAKLTVWLTRFNVILSEHQPANATDGHSSVVPNDGGEVHCNENLNDESQISSNRTALSDNSSSSNTEHSLDNN